MGAWGVEVLSNDLALDQMYDIIDSKDLESTIVDLLENGDVEEQLLAAEIVDISMNGIDMDIMGCIYDYGKFFEDVQANSMHTLSEKAYNAVKYVQTHDRIWVDSVKNDRVDLLRKIENRLVYALSEAKGMTKL